MWKSGFCNPKRFIAFKAPLILNYKANVATGSFFIVFWGACRRKKFGIPGFNKGVKTLSPPGGEQLFLTL
ncbi:hypothetical protein [Salegentibacter maritimus]|uniref:Uncharacterized protein n=1 Tax=Salegentibacter maritimus TaxID=2794347 RepID=A0ABS0TGA8_9FLAO|nr:hypothetical protein [Salegentibacter maritimus]MBI6120090.1 hypothetical protein [Salegentibacter maritimus]